MRYSIRMKTETILTNGRWVIEQLETGEYVTKKNGRYYKSTSYGKEYDEVFVDEAKDARRYKTLDNAKGVVSFGQHGFTNFWRPTPDYLEFKAIV